MAVIELQSLRLLALFLTLYHIHYAVSVVQQMCDYLKINCLSLGKRDSEPLRERLIRDNSNGNSSSDLPAATNAGASIANN